MRKRTLGVALLAGLAISGGGAFTASNTVSDSVAGYGEATVSGVTVTDVDYTMNAAADAVTAIAFVAGSDIRGKQLVLKLQNGSTDVATASNAALATNACVINATTGLGATCTFATPVSVTSYDGLAISVYDND